MPKTGPNSRVVRNVLLSLGLLSVMGMLTLLLVPRDQTLHNTYNPLTYNRHRASPKHTTDKYATILKPVTPLFDDRALQKRLEHTSRGRQGTVFTFFNDDKIRRLSIHEQHFHRTLLRKWILLHRSFGFNVQILHYNDAVENPKMKEMAEAGVLLGKKDVINENHLKLLAWSHRISTSHSKDTRGGGAGLYYTDYTLFPLNNRVRPEYPRNSEQKHVFQLTPGYGFQVMMGDLKSIDDLIDALISKNRDFNIVEADPKYSDMYADYSLGTWKKLLNTNNLKTVMDTVPELLNRHIKNWRMAAYRTFNVVDLMVVGDHYFTRAAIQGLKSLNTCDEVGYPLPTRNFLELFDKEIAPMLPERTSIDSDKESVELAESVLKGVISTYSPKCLPHKPWEVVVSNKWEQQQSKLELIAVPHPLSSASVIKHDEKRMATSSDLVSMPQRNVISSQLTTSASSQGITTKRALHIRSTVRTSSIFVPAELLTVEFFAHALSIHLGFDVPVNKDNNEVEHVDRSLTYEEVSHTKSAISEGELKWKLDSAKKLLVNYESPAPYIINQRQSEQRLKQYREELKHVKKPMPLDDPKVVLQTQNFESRHDPIVEIAESWNEDDADLWWDAKIARSIDEDLYRLLSELDAQV